MLAMQRYLVKEQVAFLKTHDTYDIFDPDSQQQVGVAKEEISGLVKTLRWFINKNLMPTQVVVRDKSGTPVLTIKRPFRLFRARVEVHDGQDKFLGYFKSKMFSLGGGFWVYDVNDKQFAEVKGDWKGWNFKFLTPEGVELGLVTKKWAGLGKELFTSADTYIVSITDSLKDQPTAKILLLAAALAIDIVFKEAK